MFLFSLSNKGLKKAVTQGIPVRDVVMSEVTQHLVYPLNELVKASVSSLQSAVVVVVPLHKIRQCFRCKLSTKQKNFVPKPQESTPHPQNIQGYSQ